MAGRFLIIKNLQARRRRDAAARRLVTRLKSFAREVRIFETERPEDLCTNLTGPIAPDDTLVSFGGDGGARIAAQFVANEGGRLAAYPAGSGNYLAHELGLALPPQAFAKLCIKSEPRDIVLGRVDASGNVASAPFCLMAGIGFDAQAVSLISEAMKSWQPTLAYVSAVMRAAMAAPAAPIQLSLDGAPFETRWAIFTNARFRARKLLLGDGAPPQFMAVLIDPRGPIEFLDALRRLALRDLGPTQYMRTIPFRTAEVASPQDALIHADGDIVGKTPCTLSAAQRLPVIAGARAM